MKPSSQRFREATSEALRSSALQQALETGTRRFTLGRLAATRERPDWEELRSRGRPIRW